MSEITEPSKLIRSKQRSCEDNQDRSAWRVLAESWLLVAAINDIVESRKSIEANSEAAPTHGKHRQADRAIAQVLVEGRGH
jgi:hypothetical protein